MPKAPLSLVTEGLSVSLLRISFSMVYRYRVHCFGPSPTPRAVWPTPGRRLLPTCVRLLGPVEALVYTPFHQVDMHSQRVGMALEWPQLQKVMHIGAR